MKISARAFLLSTLFLALATGVLIPDAGAASIVSVHFGGRVGGTLPGDTFPGNVQTNDVITTNSSFGYNALQTGLNGTYTFTGTTQSFGLFVNTPGFPTTVWSDGYTGSPNNFQIIMSVSGSTTTMDFHKIATAGGTAEAGSKVNAAIDLVLTSTTYAGGKTLPNATTISAFLLTPAVLTWDPPGAQGTDVGQGFTGLITDFNGTTVPEPSSLVLAVVAMACTSGFVITRRRAARASQNG